MKSVTNMPQSVKLALASVIVAKAKWKTINEIDKETKTKVLTDNIFTEEETGERINKPNADFLMTESDFEKYCKLVYIENCNKGIDSGAWNLNFWPYQKAVYDAEDVLIDTIAGAIPEHLTPDIIKMIKTSPNFRKEFLKITFGDNYAE